MSDEKSTNCPFLCQIHEDFRRDTIQALCPGCQGVSDECFVVALQEAVDEHDAPEEVGAVTSLTHQQRLAERADCAPTSAREQPELSQLQLPIERDRFFRRLLRELVMTLGEVAENGQIQGLVSVVGAKIGDEFHMLYREHLQQRELTRQQVAAACCDLKRRIGGDFSVVEQDDSKIVFENRVCPFGDQVLGQSSLCMMTSNVFGRLAAENLGYANVVLEKTIADGNGGCRACVQLDQSMSADTSNGREYFKAAPPERAVAG